MGREVETKSILVAVDVGKHILLEGPPGTSKSILLRKIAQGSHIPLYIIEGNVDLTPAKWVGHFNPAKVMSDGYQPEYFQKGPLSKAMEEGGIFYIEEFNRMPADVSNVLISPMEEGEMCIPRYGSVKAVHPFTLIAAQNPYDDVGTVRVSRAFMDRICLIKADCPGQNILIAARMALSNKIWLNEMTRKTADEIVEDIWNSLKAHYRTFPNNAVDVYLNQENKEKPVKEEKE